ncbi:MAG: hypothetical protein JWM56_1285 [Candidatus Peribacteria bacterium]|nr:hypothetical protein [Candidatus Peribacteria bacterium]
MVSFRAMVFIDTFPIHITLHPMSFLYQTASPAFAAFISSNIIFNLADCVKFKKWKFQWSGVLAGTMAVTEFLLIKTIFSPPFFLIPLAILGLMIHVSFRKGAITLKEDRPVTVASIIGELAIGLVAGTLTAMFIA